MLRHHGFATQGCFQYHQRRRTEVPDGKRYFDPRQAIAFSVARSPEIDARWILRLRGTVMFLLSSSSSELGSIL